MKGNCIFEIKPKDGDSHFWSSLLKIKDLFYPNCKKVIGEGKNTRIWKGRWVGDRPLKIAYPRLYLLSFDHNISAPEAIARGGGIHF